jgi:hypothetical protein
LNAPTLCRPATRCTAPLRRQRAAVAPTRWGAAFLLLVLTAGVCALAHAAVPPQPAGIVVAQIPTLTPGPAYGLVTALPLGQAASRISGLRLSVDTRWVNSYGYRPVVVAVSSPTPTTADHLITVRLHAGWWAQRWGTITVEQDFELPMGSTSAQAVVACPQYQSSIQYPVFAWEVWVDGVRDEDLSMESWTSTAPVSGPGGVWPVGYRMLVLGTAAQARQILNPGSADVEVIALPPADLPTRWIDYTCLDIVSLTKDELPQVAQSNPEAFGALCRWVRAGGQLWITEVGTQWQALTSVDEILGLLPDTATAQRIHTATVEAGDAVPNGWEPAQFRHRWRRRGQFFRQLSTGDVQRARDPDVIDRLRNDPDFVAVDSPADWSNNGRSDPNRPVNSAPWFLQKPSGLGTVQAFRTTWDVGAVMGAPASATPPQTAAEPPPDSPTPMSIALRMTRNWGSRHGLLPDEANREFSHLFVPGVGLAPVLEFCVLITLFVLVIGPLNYWLLKRSHRVHLLVITVPAGAAVVTSALFAYALLSDGLGTKVRVRSLTMLDQHTGEAVCWARLSYYAGLAPSHGLDLPSDTVLYPIIAGWDETTSDGSAVAKDRELEWDGQGAHLVSGWLASRTPTQYLAIRSRQSPYRLRLAAAGDALKATNQLGAGVSYVVVFDDAGNPFAGEHIPADSSARLLPVTQADALARWRRLVTDNAPEAPPALTGAAADLLRMQQRSRHRTLQRMFGRLEYSQQQLDRNLLNGTITDLAGLEGQPALELPPRSYLAVTDSAPEVELGIAGAAEEASFHVLLGRW